MPAADPAEQELKQLQLEEARKRNTQLAEQEASAKREKDALAAATLAGRVGRGSLLSGDWSGYQRGGDLAGRA